MRSWLFLFGKRILKGGDKLTRELKSSISKTVREGGGRQPRPAKVVGCLPGEAPGQWKLRFYYSGKVFSGQFMKKIHEKAPSWPPMFHFFKHQEENDEKEIICFCGVHGLLFCPLVVDGP
jgi:hypothetical protein